MTTHNFSLAVSAQEASVSGMVQRALANGFAAEAENHTHGIKVRVRKGRDTGTCIIEPSGAVTRTSGVWRETIRHFFAEA